jgi:flagellar export protein FliJ
VFRFRLAKVLNHRRRIVEDEARRMQELAAELNRLLSRRHAFFADIEEAGRAAHGARRGTVDIALERSAAAFVEGRRRQIAMLDERVAAQEAVVESQRKVLVAAQQEVSVLERLEERQRADWEQEQRRMEQKFLDEVAGRRSAALTV